MGPVYELKYAFLYGFNGTTFAIPGTSVGVHTGDLEHVTIRVDAKRMMWVMAITVTVRENSREGVVFCDTGSRSMFVLISRVPNMQLLFFSKWEARPAAMPRAMASLSAVLHTMAFLCPRVRYTTAAAAVSSCFPPSTTLRANAYLCTADSLRYNVMIRTPLQCTAHAPSNTSPFFVGGASLSFDPRFIFS